MSAHAAKSSYLLLLWLLGNDVHQTVLQSFFVLCQSILFPCIVEDSRVEVMTLHAAFKESNAYLVVWLLLKLQFSAVLHELSEFRGVSTAKIFKGSLNLLFLDRSILFILASAWEALPWQCSFDKVKENVANGFQIITSRLLLALVRSN